jgi:RNA polymerase sigma factor (sigma-70 family)
MAGEARNAILLRDLQSVFDFGVVRDVSDRELLERFLVADHAEAQAAFAFLVMRHGPMVLHVCRQLLDDGHDAEDAFQATFLVFLRRAGSIRKRDALASWLFGVATRVARRARDSEVVRRFHERHAGELMVARKAETVADSDGRATLHEEISRLPLRYREPIVLCHLEGLSTSAAAGRLGCAHGTVLSRLARARARLRRRLTQRGRAELAVPFVLAHLPKVDATPPLGLVKLTVQAATHALSGRAVSGALVAPSVVALTQATSRTLSMTRITLVAALLTTATGISAITVSVVGPRWVAGSAAVTTGNATQKPREKPRQVEQKADPSRDLENALYRILERDRAFTDPRWPFAIKVRDVQEGRLIDATFRHRVSGSANEIDAVVQVSRAVLRVDLKAKVVHAILEEPEIQRLTADSGIVLIRDKDLDIPIPPGAPLNAD